MTDFAVRRSRLRAGDVIRRLIENVIPGAKAGDGLEHRALARDALVHSATAVDSI